MPLRCFRIAVQAAILLYLVGYCDGTPHLPTRDNRPLFLQLQCCLELCGLVSFGGRKPLRIHIDAPRGARLKASASAWHCIR